MAVRFRCGVLLAVIFASLGSAASAQYYVPGPRITIPSMSPGVFAKIEDARAATRFIRPDGAPRYILFRDRAKLKGMPRDLTVARGRAYIEAYRGFAGAMGCQTDDIADAYMFLFEAAMLTYNGSHFAPIGSAPVISCGSTSWGASQWNSVVHIFLGRAPGVATMPVREKQAFYEAMIALGGYLLDNVTRDARTAKSARADANDLVRSMIGYRAQRVRLSDGGVSIADE